MNIGKDETKMEFLVMGANQASVSSDSVGKEQAQRAVALREKLCSDN